MRDRYRLLFDRLRAEGAGAFVPFTVLGDPDPATSLEIVRTLVTAGADALELGLPFSDPVADGPTIQAADVRALAAGTRLQHVWALLQALRVEFPALPVGLLVYANLVERHGAAAFYATAAAAGVDSVLVADVPTLEAAPYAAAALAAGVLPVLIATPSCSDATLREIAALGRGYTYVVTRSGVTGVDVSAPALDGALLERLAAVQAAPALLGFGIAQPDHVRAALALGAAGAISGSAVVQRIERHLDDPSTMLQALAAFVREMKAATRRPR